jgi:hypothetical protein
MKLRIHKDSLRLRLNRSDVEQFRETGMCAELLRFGPDSQLIYTLGVSSHLKVMEAEYRQDCIRILLPIEAARRWVASDQISLSLAPRDGSGPALLIEKDFQCLHSNERSPSDDAESFPNPLADDPGGEAFR